MVVGSRHWVPMPVVGCWGIVDSQGVVDSLSSVYLTLGVLLWEFDGDGVITELM